MASGSLGSLVVSLAVDTARFQGDLGRAAAVAESKMRNIKDTASRAFGVLTVAATAAGAAVTAMLVSATNRADNMRDLAQAAGVTVEQLSRLSYAGKQSSVDVDQIVKALALLSSQGAPDAAAALSSIADRFAALPDGAEKTSLAIDYFGKKLGPYLIPLLNEGSAGLKRFADQSDAVGNTISSNAARSADAFNDKLGLLRATVDGLGNSLAAEMLPVMNAVADQMVNAATQADNMGRAVTQLATLMKILVDVGYSVYKTFDDIGSAIGAILAADVAILKGHFSEAIAILKQANADQIQSEKEANQFLANLWETRESDAARAAARLRAITRHGGSGELAKADTPLTSAAEAAAAALEKERDKLIAAGQAAIEAMQTPAEKVRRVFDETRAALLEMLKLVPEKAPEIQKALERLAASSQESLDALTRPQADVRALGQELIDSVATPAELIRQHFEDAKIALQAFIAQFPELAPQAEEALKRIAAISDEQLEALKRSGNEVKKTTDAMSAFADQAARNMQSAFADFLFDPFDKGIKGMLKGFIDIIRRMIAEAIAAKLFEKLFPQGGGGGNSFLNTLLQIGGSFLHFPGSTPTVPHTGSGGMSGFGGGVRAAGGSVSSGTSFLVGEKGPELFRPRTDGMIMPNGKGAGPQQVTNLTFAPVHNINVDSRSDRAAVRQDMVAIAVESNKQMIESLRDFRSRGAQF